MSQHRLITSKALRSYRKLEEKLGTLSRKLGYLPATYPATLVLLGCTPQEAHYHITSNIPDFARASLRAVTGALQIEAKLGRSPAEGLRGKPGASANSPGSKAAERAI